MTDKSDTKNEVFMMKRMEPVFWLDNKCPICGHRSQSIYTPELLEGNIDCECQSKFNPLRINTPCCAEWSIAMNEEKRKYICDMIEIAKRQDELYEEIYKNRKTLGYRRDER